MIFQHTWQQVLSGGKTQTRRLVEEGDTAHSYETVLGIGIHWVMRYSQGYPDGRIIYEVGKTYSVQPGRGQVSVGRVELLAIRRERVQDITPTDALAEGWSENNNWSCSTTHRFSGDTGAAVIDYANLWDSIHTAKGKQWQDNPEVWVLTFEACEDGER